MKADGDPTRFTQNLCRFIRNATGPVRHGTGDDWYDAPPGTRGSVDPVGDGEGPGWGVRSAAMLS